METSSQQKDNYFYDLRDEYLTNENLGQWGLMFESEGYKAVKT